MQKRLILVLFSAAILFAMIREWSAPAACPLPAVMRFAPRKVGSH